MDKKTLDFLKNLKKNNNREWFNENKTVFKTAQDDFTEFVENLITSAIKMDPELKGVRAKDCIFRIYKDVRFARDKSPYKENFGAFLVPGGKKSGRAGYYIHVEPGGNTMVAGGLYMPPGPNLNKIRAHIATNSKDLRKLIKSAAFKKDFGELDGERLKTAPKGYPKDHPDLDLLQLKSFTVFKKVSDATVLKSDFSKTILTGFKKIKPLVTFLNEGLAAK